MPDVYWINDDLTTLWSKPSDREHQALGAALDRLQRDRLFEVQITDALRDSLPPRTRLQGLEARMKSPSSMAGKVARKRRGDEVAAQTAQRVTDTLRYTACVSQHDEIVPTARRVLAALQARGMSVIEASDTYAEGALYKGLHFLIRDGETTFELQVHSECSQQVKDKIHPAYEVLRDPEASDLDRAAARERCVELSRGVPTPRGLAEATEFGGCPITRP